MDNMISYFRKKIMQQPYSDLLDDKQLTNLLNEKFKTGELTELFINKPVMEIEEKIKLLKKIPFYKEENLYIESIISGYKNTKIFSLEELVTISKKIQEVTFYINNLYEKSINKKKLYQEIKPLIQKIEAILKEDMPIYLKDEYEINKRKLFKYLNNQTFKQEDLELLISKVEKSIEEYNYTKAQKQKHQTKYKQKYKQKLTNIASVITIVAFLFSSYRVSSWVVDNYNVKKEMKTLEDVSQVKYSEDSMEYSNYLFDVDFSKLNSINNETVGYIRVKGTNIDYPIVQSSDNSYYLRHSFSKQYNDSGWIFLDFRNDINNLGKNNIIYAHGRLDGTMFGSLRNVLDKSWYENKDNYIVTIVDNNKTTLWSVFSVYKIKTENYYITTNFSNNVEYLDFIKTITQRSIYNFNNNLTINDRILTLSTCYDETQRVVLHAKLIKEIDK